MISPIICTETEATDFLGLSAADIALTLPDGTTLENYLKALIKRTASSVVNMVGRDYTPAQVITQSWLGDALNFRRMPSPIKSITSYTTWNPSTPNVGVVVVTVAGTLYVGPCVGGNDDTIYYYNGQFAQNVWQQIVYVNSDYGGYPVNASGGAWPDECVLVQLEMIASALSKSNIGVGSFLPGWPYVDIKDRTLQRIEWSERLRPYRFQPI